MECVRHENTDQAGPRNRTSRLPSPRRCLAVEALEARQMLTWLPLAEFYTEGKGSGLSFQQLEGFSLVTTYSTIIEGVTGYSALQGLPVDHATGDSPPREGFEFHPALRFDDPTGNLVGWDASVGGTAPWLIRPELVGQEGAVQDLTYPTRYVPDSASTGTALNTGTKTYNGAIGVDIYEQSVENVLQQAQQMGKSTGVVSSVPISHATPAVAMAHHGHRFRRDGAFPALDNTLQQALRETKPTVLLGGGHPIIGRQSYVRESTLAALREPADGLYDEWTLVERGPDVARRLANTASKIDPRADQHLVGVFGAQGQNGNLPWATADGDFSATGTTGRRDPGRPLAAGESPEQFITRQRHENPRLYQLADAALDVLEDDPDGFWLMIESGDIDWAMHDNNIDNAVGSILEFDLAVETVLDWIERHGGFEENLLIVTADHDHYLTLHDDYPELATTRGLHALTPPDSVGDADQNGHHWGPFPDQQFGWSSHTRTPVPAYYQGPQAVMRQWDQRVGTSFVSYGQSVPGVEGMLDQVQVHQAMSQALSDDLAQNVILMIGDGMGWEVTRAAAIAAQVQPPQEIQARRDPSGVLVIRGTNQDDVIRVRQTDGRVSIESGNRKIPIDVGGRSVDHVTSWLLNGMEFFGWQGEDRFMAEGLWQGGPVYQAGDANRDGVFNQLDLVDVLQSARYLSDEWATWEQGDWTGDALFDQLDIVAALQTATYLR